VLLVPGRNRLDWVGCFEASISLTRERKLALAQGANKNLHAFVIGLTNHFLPFFLIHLCTFLNA
jgi:hypothetical protein